MKLLNLIVRFFIIMMMVMTFSSMGNAKVTPCDLGKIEVNVNISGAGEVKLVEYDNEKTEILRIRTISTFPKKMSIMVYNSAVSLKALPYDGYDFVKWTSDGTSEEFDETANPVTVYNDKTYKMTAVFKKEVVVPTPPPEDDEPTPKPTPPEDDEPTPKPTPPEDKDDEDDSTPPNDNDKNGNDTVINLPGASCFINSIK